MVPSEVAAAARCLDCVCGVEVSRLVLALFFGFAGFCHAIKTAKSLRTMIVLFSSSKAFFMIRPGEDEFVTAMADCSL